MWCFQESLIAACDKDLKFLDPKNGELLFNALFTIRLTSVESEKPFSSITLETAFLASIQTL